MQIMVTWFFRIPYRYLGAALGTHGPEIRALTARSSFPWYASLEIFGQQRHLGRSRWWKTSSKWRKIGTPHITLMGWSNGTYMHQLAKNLLTYIISICMHIYIYTTNHETWMCIKSSCRTRCSRPVFPIQDTECKRPCCRISASLIGVSQTNGRTQRLIGKLDSCSCSCWLLLLVMFFADDEDDGFL